MAWTRAVLFVSGLMGAGGVALAAAAAHIGGGAALSSAALLLVLHGTAGLSVGLCANFVRPARHLLIGASLLIAGSILFGGAIALLALAGLRPLPLAAPTGGVLMIAGWLWLAVSGMLVSTKS